MRALAEAAAVERFRDLLTDRLGLRLDREALDPLLSRRVALHGRDYLNRLAQDALPGEFATLATELVVNETYFFRHQEQFKALASCVLPERAHLNPGNLSIVSAGCATGEEPYTIAMVVRDTLPERARNTTILGVDVDPEALVHAEQAEYRAWTLRATAPEMRRRWFVPTRDGATVTEEIRRAVRFIPRNLVDDDPRLWPAGAYDVVFCRNVLMYFTAARARTVLLRLIRALTPGGYLFLGEAETLRALCPEAADQLEVRHSHGTFYYQRPAPAVGPRVSGSRGAPAPGPSPARLIPAEAAVLDQVRDLLLGERYAEALDMIATVPATNEVLIVLGALLQHQGELDRAEAVAHELLAADGLNGPAHYLLGVCAQARGDVGAAVERYRLAVYVDPGFAMPRLRLGVLARQRGDLTTALRELGHAQLLLAGESPDRLLLFGGGFDRVALVDLCQAELHACGSLR
jgi:chemotaxis protein methyltransferase CheR